MTRIAGHRSAKSIFAAILAVVFIGAVPSLASAIEGPADNFASATAITVSSAPHGFTATPGGSTTNFGKEPNEQSHVGVPPQHSGWWTWTPTVSGPTTLTTCGTSYANLPYDTWLAVYTGSAVNQLNTVAENDDVGNGTCGSGNEGLSALTFSANANQKYYFVVDSDQTSGGVQLNLKQNTDRVVSVFVTTKVSGSGSVSSVPAGINGCTISPPNSPPASSCTTTVPDGTPIKLTATPDQGSRFIGWSGSGCDSQTEFTCTFQPHGEFNSFAEFETIPANDDIANAEELPLDVSQATGTTVGASLEPNESSQQDTLGKSSVWYKWTSGGTSHLTTIDVCQEAGPGGGQRVAVYKTNDFLEAPIAAGACRISFNSDLSQDYYISVDSSGVDNQTNFALYLTSADPPANDNFVNAATLTGDHPGVAGNNSGATHEPGETSHGGFSETASLWYKWTAPADGTSVVATCDPTIGLDTSLGVYTGIGAGTTISDLTEIDTNDNDEQNLTNCYLQSAVQFDVTQGTTYYFAVDSNAGATGDIKINLSLSRALHHLTVTPAGSGDGTVESDDLSCDTTDNTSDCSTPIDVEDNTQITLTATPKPGSTFTGWSGDCTGTAPCVLTPDDDVAVTATFAARRTLTYGVSGNGTGIIASQPNVIGAGCTTTSCSSTQDEGTAVTLSATPAAGSTFTGWSGDCSGTGTCSLTLSSNKTATATFAKVKHTLAYATAGAGTGTISSSPQLSGSNCSSTSCSTSLDEGTAVALTPAAAPGSKFTGWSGDCSGTGNCQVTITKDTSVTATFTTDRIDPLFDLKLQIGKAKLNKKSGTAVVPVTVNGAASVTLSGKGIKTRKATTTRASTVKFAITPTGATKTKLKRAGKARVAVKVSASNANSNSGAGFSLTLKKTKKKKH